MQTDPKTTLIVLLVLAVAILGYMVVSSTQNNNSPEKSQIQCTVPSDLKITYDAPPQSEELKGSYWACNNLACNKILTPQEWVMKNCLQQQDQILCRLRTAQGDLAYPLAALNLTAIKECAEYTCQQEVLVRNASYTILPPK